MTTKETSIRDVKISCQHCGNKFTQTVNGTTLIWFEKDMSVRSFAKNKEQFQLVCDKCGSNKLKF